MFRSCFFSDDQAELKRHLGHVGPTRLDSYKNVKNFPYGNAPSYWSQVPLKFSVGTKTRPSSLIAELIKAVNLAMLLTNVLQGFRQFFVATIFCDFISKFSKSAAA